jgi:hypothetical protein
MQQQAKLQQQQLKQQQQLQQQQQQQRRQHGQQQEAVQGQSGYERFYQELLRSQGSAAGAGVAAGGKL